MIIPRLASALRRTARIAVQRPRAGLWTQLALICALVAVGVAAIAAASVARWTAARPSSTARMVVYLGDGVGEARAQALVRELRTLPGIETAVLVPADESARRLTVALGSDASLLDGVDVTTLPASVEVTLAPGVRDVVALSPTVTALRGAPGVVDVVVEDAGTDRIAGALTTVRAIAWAALALFAGLALIVVLAAVRLRLDRSGAERRELEVAQLLGAGPGFVVVPTALAGALHGMFAALLATIAVGLGLEVYGSSITESLASTLGSVEIVVPELIELACFVGIGAAIGMLGGLLAGASRAR